MSSIQQSLCADIESHSKDSDHVKSHVVNAASPMCSKDQRSRDNAISDSILLIERSQYSSLLVLDYSNSSRTQSNVTHIYNPLSYASIPHSKFVKYYGNSIKKVLFLGMNPGPYGMAQTGVSA